MTFEECQRAIEPIRRRQGTEQPVIRVDYAGSVYRGRLTRVDSDRILSSRRDTPYGLLVLDEPGLARGSQTILQIASISPGCIQDPSGN